MNYLHVIIIVGIVLLFGFSVGLNIRKEKTAIQFDRTKRRSNGDMTGGDSMAKMVINGVEISGDNIQVFNGRVVVDGIDQTTKFTDVNALNQILEIKVIDGTIHSLTTSASVTCNDVTGSVDAGGSVNAQAVGGDIDAGGSVTCGNVAGSIDAGGSVKCGSVGGSIDAGGSVRHG